MRFAIENFGVLIGCAGVASDENLRARRLAMLFEVPLLLAAIWIMLNWWSSTHAEPLGSEAKSYDLVLWMLFAAETLVLSIAVDRTRDYLSTNWLNLVIIVVGLPLFLGVDVHAGALRLLRLVVLFALLLHVGGRLRQLLARNELGTTIVATAIVVTLAGIMMAAIDPAIDSPWDGIWWSWVTITTVGYGDLVPTSGVGRVFAALIILLGLGLFALLTGAFAAFFIEQKEEEIVGGHEQLLGKLAALEKKLEKLESKLDRLVGSVADQKDK